MKKEKRINIVKKTGACCSYFIDTNGLLRGEWGGYEENFLLGKNQEHIHRIYYSIYNTYIPINEYGYFYNKFDCRVYDGIYEITNGFYICEKNSLFGIIDENENVLIPTVCRIITTYLHEDRFIIAKISRGKFLYNTRLMKRSKIYDDIFVITESMHRNSIFFQNNNKYGILNSDCSVLLPAKYDYSKYSSKLYYTHQGLKFSIFVKNGLLYGHLPISSYDICFRVGNNTHHYYITQNDGKYGLLSKNRRIISKPFFDDIVLFRPNNICGGYRLISFFDIKRKINVSIIFVIARKNDKYWLYNGLDGTCFLENCDNIYYNDSKYNYDLFVEFEKKGKHGFVMSGGVILNEEDYERIVFSKDVIYVKKNGKTGLLRNDGFEWLPCIYDSIHYVDEGIYRVSKNNKEENITLYKTNNNYCHPQWESQHYYNYSGSYAQEEQGYSDEEIDTLFDGNVDASWNID
ncbi:MAG: WG repeat-containing protein [Bacteroidaceae bacterium]|nr:WG repeat-containing protein [Bacteroidaceae bacterium]